LPAVTISSELLQSQAGTAPPLPEDCVEAPWSLIRCFRKGSGEVRRDRGGHRDGTLYGDFVTSEEVVNADSTRCVHCGIAPGTVLHVATVAVRLCHIVGEPSLEEESGAPLHDVLQRLLLRKTVHCHIITVHHNRNVTRQVSIRRQASTLDEIGPPKPEVVPELILNMILICTFMGTVGPPTHMKTSCKDPGWRHHPRTPRHSTRVALPWVPTQPASRGLPP